MNQKPTLGRVVIYHTPIAKYAAVISDIVAGTTVCLHVMMPDGVSVVNHVEHEESDITADSYWDWPEIVKASQPPSGMVVIGNGQYHDTFQTFSVALMYAKQGGAIKRDGWNRKCLTVMAQFPDEHSKMSEPYLFIEYPDGKRCPWLPSQTDLMAEDWTLLPKA